MPLQVKYLGLQPYESTWEAMQRFTNERTEHTPDELWVVEHPPVFTQGLNGQAKHLQAFALEQNIPIIQTDRGGQVTYHGPGQIIIYVLLDLKRAQLGVRDLVHRMEKAIIEFLCDLSISADARPDAPGVYVDGQKIASLGLKIRKQKSYHGLALNFDMDLTPFSWITPCGLEGIQMTQVSHFIQQPDQLASQTALIKALCHQLQPEIDS
uniref:Octanoyltransferase n=1 Tax=Hydrogenovibrio crunogenus (strain DSM 25203 / XCL-2) TaxID=317025 RepID=LIPB_HYDCU|nr:RecName: Full=Octanoyltransferase; AltName: Full=Lipoate-protein ligase B; AltName: Full=Lipoyl/octanoyl transferase; AltName: Full=Octanoyl-[acyl-carrier-protein]-protein N-octanoyltransferase [Hydrogenovibrio crunogenus XCL-2]